MEENNSGPRTRCGDEANGRIGRRRCRGDCVDQSVSAGGCSHDDPQHVADRLRALSVPSYRSDSVQGCRAAATRPKGERRDQGGPAQRGGRRRTETDGGGSRWAEVDRSGALS